MSRNFVAYHPRACKHPSTNCSTPPLPPRLLLGRLRPLDVLCEHHWNSAEPAIDALAPVHPVSELFLNLAEREHHIVFIKRNGPRGAVLSPLAAEAGDDALAEEGTEIGDELVYLLPR